jgi:hypothetical protein
MPREKPEPSIELKPITRVGGVRSEFGTRVARRVDCARCGRSDHVAYIPKERERALCRDCAAEVLRAYEHGVKARMPMRDAACNLCGTPFQLPITAEDDGDLLCPSCLRGWTGWQGSLETPFAERAGTTLENRRSGNKVRRRTAKSDGDPQD